MERELLNSQYKTLCNHLFDEQNKEGFWTGHLSSSALATSVSIVAFKLYDHKKFCKKIEYGIQWLLNTINSDGGFGDTPESESNVSTSLLCYAALRFCRSGADCDDIIMQKLENYFDKQNIQLGFSDLAKSVLKFYGKDFTFSVPILTFLAICNISNDHAFENIPQLPFELSLLPRWLFRFFNLQVVSYAIPALIAVGIIGFKKRRNPNLLMNFIRRKAIVPALKKLLRIMPESGGFLEAIPLTAFVCVCLIASGFNQSEIVKRGIFFLENKQREDGSWPIDTDLSTWVTTLSIKATGHTIFNILPPEQIEILKQYLLKTQCKEKHPFNGALEGGWGWTKYTGSVPDADDTPGAILALLELYKGEKEITDAVCNGCEWLVKLQNKDGGIPTFCKGWGRLPFDKSCADLTSHTLLALIRTIDMLNDKLQKEKLKMFNKCAKRAVRYLQQNQYHEGYWLPLWFGNQLNKDKKNPVYGTAKVVIYFEDCIQSNYLTEDLRLSIKNMLFKARNYLLLQQNEDGSWGGQKGLVGTIEETALSVSALTPVNKEACLNAIEWLEKEYQTNGLRSNPIGLYFASLWYDEKLYPLVFYIEALRRFNDYNY